ncbi:hypothetical protein [Halobacillus litoralis]|uniref:Uncharacterized protein n=1 Tax=Halobacillus litoralis TaxID=45668 RepID=A0A410MCC3_9BACI|nr:hypothetical protein [Halobacillus litoralis]QAS52357.1 hypothetical protein HLI_08995 [Halobacillus litoralis]
MAELHYQDKRKIENVIEEIAYSRVKRFYPTIVSKATDLPLNTVFEYLLKLTLDGRLKLEWEIRCDDYECNSLILRTDDIDQFIGQYVECECEREILINENIIFPVFSISGHYRQDIRESKKKSPSLLKAL